MPCFKGDVPVHIGILDKDINISNDLLRFLSKHRPSKKNSSQLLKEAERVIREIGNKNFALFHSSSHVLSFASGHSAGTDTE